MPESEPKPKLIELVAPGAGQGWKAVLKNGKPAVIHEISAAATEAAAAVPRIQRLAEHRHPSLAPVLAWGTEPNGVWVAVEPNEGTPLGTILSRGPLTPPAAAALGASILSGVAALHEAGIAMGGFGAAAVRVTGNGEVRLSGHPAAAVRGAPSQSDLRADVRSCGMAICAAFGVDPAGAPAPPSIPPGLVVTMRSMASGAMGPAADRAQGALREMASALLAPDRMTAAQSELALRAGGRELPSATPYLPKDTFPPAPAASPAPAPAPAPAPQIQGPLPWATPAQAPAPPSQANQTWGPPPSPTQETEAPAAYTPPPPDEMPARTGVSYDPPPRSTDTYPAIPVPPVPPPFVPPSRQEPAPAAPIPTWDAAPATPAHQPGEETWDTVPSAPPTAPTPPAAPTSPAPKPSATSSWDTFPPAPRPEASSTAAAPSETAPSEPEEEAPAAGAKSTWTAIPTPTWTPAADVAPAEAPAEAPPKREPTPEPLPAVPAYVAPAPAAKATPVPAITPDEPVSAPARKPPQVRRPGRDLLSERPPWLVPAAIAIVVLLLIGIVGTVVLANRGSSPRNIATTSPKTSPKGSPKSSPSGSTALLPVPTYAPLTNPPFTRVQFCLPQATCPGGTSADTNCTLNSTCHVDFGVYYSGPVGQLTYWVEFFDRCANTSTEVFKQTRTPNPIYRSFIPAPTGGFPVTLPSAKAGAIVVVVESGTTQAASAPYDLPGSATTCA